MNGLIDCRYCETEHGDRYLCDPVKRYIDAAYARGAELTMPDVIFPEPLPADLLGLGLDTAAGDRLATQLVVQAITIDVVTGLAKPGLVFTGLDHAHRPLPKWFFPGDPRDLDAIAQLVSRMTGLAIRTARQKNRRPA